MAWRNVGVVTWLTLNWLKARVHHFYLTLHGLRLILRVLDHYRLLLILHVGNHYRLMIAWVNHCGLTEPWLLLILRVEVHHW